MLEINLDKIFGLNGPSKDTTEQKQYQITNKNTLNNTQQEKRELTVRKYKIPGQRLYYQSISKIPINAQRVQQKIYFYPLRIHKRVSKSIIILKYYQKSKEQHSEVKNIEPIKSSQQLKLEKQLSMCTFKPKLITKNKTNTKRNNQQVFINLYKDYSLRYIKQSFQKQLLSENKLHQTMNKQQLELFLRKNQQVIKNKVSKIQKISQKINNIDLTTGKKLFVPQTNKKIGYYPKTPNRKFTSHQQYLQQSRRIKLKYNQLRNMSLSHQDTQPMRQSLQFADNQISSVINFGDQIKNQ